MIVHSAPIPRKDSRPRRTDHFQTKTGETNNGQEGGEAREEISAVQLSIIQYRGILKWSRLVTISYVTEIIWVPLCWKWRVSR